MERQTLQQQTPVYHVCQACGGDGCAACSDLCILDGDIQLDPECDEEIPSASPINGVIGNKVHYVLCQDCLRILPYTDELHQTEGSCVCGGDMCGCGGCDEQAHMLLAGVRDWRVLDIQKPISGWSADGGCILSPSPKTKYDITFDDRNMYQRREDDLRLAGEWEV
ncbi:hypothetical protein SJS38_02270 [Aeromonas dhakensis]|uniref:hypothetical protein n=1 Tax=Aeromonas dhakensis TaxID=196024 RepID=UPI0029D932AB|nr:hypothetical protein [Aeromonas dhakensis]MDX7694805.1 hypothetical protein [Aeromonas dhakensis]